MFNERPRRPGLDLWKTNFNSISFKYTTPSNIQAIQAINERCIFSAPFLCPVCQFSGASRSAADGGNLFQMLPGSVCLHLGQIMSEKGIIKTRIKQHSSHPAWSDGNLRVREAEFLLPPLCFGFERGGHVSASQLSLAGSKGSVAPESCDANTIGKEIFGRLLELAICRNQMCED